VTWTSGPSCRRNSAATSDPPTKNLPQVRQVKLQPFAPPLEWNTPNPLAGHWEVVADYDTQPLTSCCWPWTWIPSKTSTIDVTLGAPPTTQPEIEGPEILWWFSGQVGGIPAGTSTTVTLSAPNTTTDSCTWQIAQGPDKVEILGTDDACSATFGSVG
jgi:hypothetical protein